MLLVSVIVPAYNAERFIEETLRSAMAQTHGHLEIIVVNDGSIDATGAIVDRLATEDLRIRQVRTANGGVARARNLGIAEGKGQLFAFLDADDLWHPRKIELQAQALTGSSGSQFGASYAFHRTIDASNRIIAHPRAVACSGYILARHLFKKFVGNGSSVMVRRDLARAVGGFDGDYRDRGLGGCEDLDFELKLAARSEIVAVPLYLVGHRQYDGNMSSNRSRMARSLVATISSHIAANPKLPTPARRYAMAASYEWAGRQLRASGDYVTAARYLLTVPFLDPIRGLFMAAAGLRSVGAAVAQLFRSTTSIAVQGPMFQDMDPCHGGPGPNALERHRLRQLERVDSALKSAKR